MVRDIEWSKEDRTAFGGEPIADIFADGELDTANPASPESCAMQESHLPLHKILLQVPV